MVMVIMKMLMRVRFDDVDNSEYVDDYDDDEDEDDDDY